ncbi:MAG TPA: hypothetical protein VGE29_11150 [Prosthecobacter sp.]
MLRSHDIAVAIKLLETKGTLQVPTFASLANSLILSASEVHAAVKRGLEAGLLRKPLSNVSRSMPVPNSTALAEFLIHGLKYIWPVTAGATGRGVATGASLPQVAQVLNLSASPVSTVWLHPEGDLRGESIKPLYAQAAAVALKDPFMHEWLALLDLVRAKAGREATLAADHIQDRLS